MILIQPHTHTHLDHIQKKKSDSLRLSVETKKFLFLFYNSFYNLQWWLIFGLFCFFSISFIIDYICWWGFLFPKKKGFSFVFFLYCCCCFQPFNRKELKEKTKPIEFKRFHYHVFFICLPNHLCMFACFIHLVPLSCLFPLIFFHQLVSNHHFFTWINIFNWNETRLKSNKQTNKQMQRRWNEKTFQSKTWIKIDSVLFVIFFLISIVSCFFSSIFPSYI